MTQILAYTSCFNGSSDWRANQTEKAEIFFPNFETDCVGLLFIAKQWEIHRRGSGPTNSWLYQAIVQFWDRSSSTDGGLLDNTRGGPRGLWRYDELTLVSVMKTPNTNIQPAVLVLGGRGRGAMSEAQQRNKGVLVEATGKRKTFNEDSDWTH